MFTAKGGLMRPPPAPAAQVMVDAVSVGVPTKGSAGTPKSATDSIVVNGANPNRLLLAAFSTSSGAAVTPTAGNVQCTSDVGGAFTQISDSQQMVPTNLGSIQWRYLLAPAGGTHSVIGNYNGAGWVNGVCLILLSLYNVDQATPFGACVKTFGNNQDVNNSVTADAGDLILWALTHASTINDLNQTVQRINIGSSDSGYGDYTSVYGAAGTGAAVQLFTATDSVHACSGLPVLAA